MKPVWYMLWSVSILAAWTMMIVGEMLDPSERHSTVMALHAGVWVFAFVTAIAHTIVFGIRCAHRQMENENNRRNH